VSPLPFCTLAFCLLAALGASNDADPWTRVPPLPTSGYQSDGFAGRLETAEARATADVAHQDEINRQVSAKLGEIDPMELAAKQQQYMMDHPQEAMAMLQRNANLGQTTADNEVGGVKELEGLNQELEALDARYKAALAQALAPVMAKYADLDRRAQKDLVLTEAGSFYAEWAAKEFNALRLEENAAYEAFAPAWWGASGQYRGWVDKYRDHLVRLLPGRVEAEQVGAGMMVWVIELPAGSFKPIAPLHAVREYMQTLSKVYARRRSEPLTPLESVGLGTPATRR
jgi:hypothetical protein